MLIQPGTIVTILDDPRTYEVSKIDDVVTARHLRRMAQVWPTDPTASDGGGWVFLSDLRPA